MFVARSTGNFAAGGAVYFLSKDAVYLAVFDNSGSGDTEDLLSEVAVHSVEIIFDGHHPSLPLHLYKWVNLVPIHISLPLVLWQHWGLLGSVALS